MTLVPHPFYGMVRGGDLPFVARVAMAAGSRYARSAQRPFALRMWWWLVARTARLPLLVWAIVTRDVFIFGFASTFFGYLELPLLKLFGRRVVFVFHGSDSRPPYLNGAGATASPQADPHALVQSTRQVKKRVRKIDRWADVVVDNPLSAHFHERLIVSFLAIGIPRTPLPDRRIEQDVIRVLHCPSRPAAGRTFCPE